MYLTQQTRVRQLSVLPTLLFLTAFLPALVSALEPRPLRLVWQDNQLSIRGDQLPVASLRVWYVEAYCRAGSTDRDWHETTIAHTTRLLSATEDRIELQCKLTDGTVIDHVITATHDSVDFRLTAHNPTRRRSQVVWGQPCVQVGEFTGCDQQTYLAKSFVFVDGEQRQMPTHPWATQARYTPGQVWAAPGIDRNDVNPRPLNPKSPDHGLIGCYSADESTILASAWEPYQELFQGVLVCLHSDFRIGGLSPGEIKKARGKLYIVPNDIGALLKRYQDDFPEHFRQ